MNQRSYTAIRKVALLDLKFHLEIEERLRRLEQNSIPGIPELASWKISRLEFEIEVSTETKIATGCDLYSCMRYLSSKDRQNILELLFNLLIQWRAVGFIHGDLSLRNLIFDAKTKSLSAIDWLLVLNSHQGTPSYASEEVFRGRHSFDSDYFAACVIAVELGSNTFPHLARLKGPSLIKSVAYH